MNSTPCHNRISSTIRQGCQTALAEPSLAAGAFFVADGAGGPAAQGAGFEAYKDSIANVSQEVADGRQSCGLWFSHASCAGCGHHFAKKLLCGKEWCKSCGQDESAAHRRRQARMLPKIQQLETMGQVVIEFPESYRKVGELCYSKVGLRNTTNLVIDVLAGQYTGHRVRTGGFFGRGTLRWHWFGEVCVHSHSEKGRRGLRCEFTGKRCPKRKCEKFENNGKWNPHLNVLVDAGRLSKGALAELKKALRVALGVPNLIVNYSYAKATGKMVHAVKYITRATFKDYSWNQYMAAELYNFRNVRAWGKWDDVPLWELKEIEGVDDVSELEAVSKLQEHICPDCGRGLSVKGVKTRLNVKTGEREIQLDAEGLPMPRYWSRPLPVVYLEWSNAVEIGASGYYRIPPGWIEDLPQAPEDKLTLAEIRALNRVRLRKLRGEAVKERRRANWRRYIDANRTRYILSGGDEV